MRGANAICRLCLSCPIVMISLAQQQLRMLTQFHKLRTSDLLECIKSNSTIGATESKMRLYKTAVLMPVCSNFFWRLQQRSQVKVPSIGKERSRAFRNQNASSIKHGMVRRVKVRVFCMYPITKNPACVCGELAPPFVTFRISAIITIGNF